jgi:hypothetical protein
MKTKFDEIIFFTDNSAVVHWLLQPGIKPRFLAKIIEKILRVTRDIRHISTHLNAADPASRGLTMSELANHELWWCPSFLKLEEKYWPIPVVQPVTKNLTNNVPVDLKYLLKEDEIPSTKIFSTLKAEPEKLLNFICIEQYSSYNTLLSTATNMLLFLKKICLKIGKEILQDYCKFSTCNYIQLRRLAEKLLITFYQQQYPPSEQLKLLLNLRHDEHGIIRCYHRLEKAYPNGLIYLPHGYLTQLIIIEYHKIFLHAGTKHILNELRKNYWIHQGRAYLNKILRANCFTCRRHKAKYFNLPLMPQLPNSRVTYERPFQNIGIDYCGPFTIKSGNDPVKCWVVLFTCLSIRAIHLDLTLALDTVSFLNVFRRFVARRGKPVICLDIYN